MTDDQQKAWDELVKMCQESVDDPDDGILSRHPEETILAADAELTALRARVALLEQAVEWCEDLLMGTIPEYPDYDNVQALAELRRKAKEG